MYCPTCGNEITAELNYCNRCGANLTMPVASTTTVLPPIKLTGPSIVLALTILIGLAIIFGSATDISRSGVHPPALVFMVLFSVAALFGCVGLMVRFWTKLLTMQRETTLPPPQQPRPPFPDRQTVHHLPPQRMEPVPSVTENTTRTFSPVYREPADRGTR